MHKDWVLFLRSTRLEEEAQEQFLLEKEMLAELLTELPPYLSMVIQLVH